ALPRPRPGRPSGSFPSRVDPAASPPARPTSPGRLHKPPPGLTVDDAPEAAPCSSAGDKAKVPLSDGKPVPRLRTPSGLGVPINPSAIDLLEPETPVQIHRRLVALHGLNFNQPEVLFLKIAGDGGQQEFGQPLPAKVFQHHQPHNTDGGQTPTPAEPFHFPYLGPGDRLAGRGFAQAEVEQFDRPQGTLAPPGV